jgi:serine protease Do
MASELKPANRPSRLNSRRVGAAALLLILMVASGFSGAWFEQRHNEVSVSDLSSEKKVVTGQSQLISKIAETVGPSVVSVNVAITSADSSDLFGTGQSQQAQAAGTGIIIDKSGLIITNRHVVPDGTTSVSVTLSDGTELKDIKIIGRTNTNDSLDVAFLKINDLKGRKLTPAVIGDSAKVHVGDNVVAIGNALGQFQNTVTNGIISGFGRRVQAGGAMDDSAENLDNLFQTDAAINEGNSGGPLVNLNGQVIGINTAIASGSQSIGFAIPINDARGLIDQVVKTGKFARPYLGVRYVPLTVDIASQFDLKTENGAFIVPSDDPNNPSVVIDSPAAKAGLKEKDIITAVDGVKIDQTHSLTSQLSRHKPGEEVRLTILRGAKTLRIDATLGKMPAS